MKTMKELADKIISEMDATGYQVELTELDVTGRKRNHQIGCTMTISCLINGERYATDSQRITFFESGDATFCLPDVALKMAVTGPSQ